MAGFFCIYTPSKDNKDSKDNNDWLVTDSYYCRYFVFLI